VTFTPTKAGKQTGVILVTNNLPDSPETLNLTGGGQ